MSLFNLQLLKNDKFYPASDFSKDDTFAAFFQKDVDLHEEISGNIIRLKQVHSNKVVVVDDRDAELGNIEGDALVTNLKNTPIAVTTADCAPVLFCDAKNKIIAAVHAGWRGAFSGILQNTVATMLDIGADLASIQACVGPCIAQHSYEVNLEFYENFLAQAQDNVMFFIPSNKPNHYMFDLREYCNSILEKSGLQVSNVDINTYGSPEVLYSYRRATHENTDNTGRQFSAIVCR